MRLELLEHAFITQGNVSRGRDRLLEIMHQASEIKKRRLQQNFSKTGERPENFSKKSSDSDGSGQAF